MQSAWQKDSGEVASISVIMVVAATKQKCLDCDFCQMCSENRCILCRNHETFCSKSQLGPAFTYGQYLEWQEKRSMKKIPVIDIRRCTGCESCLEMCPEVFKRNSETGFIEVADLPLYPYDLVDQVIGICPADCIRWEEI
jgi:ferredoxin